MFAFSLNSHTFFMLCLVFYLRSAVVLTPILIGVTLHWSTLKHHQIRTFQTLVTQTAISRNRYMRCGKSQDNSLKAFRRYTQNCKYAVIFHTAFSSTATVLYMGNGFHSDFLRKNLCSFVCSVRGTQARKCKCYWQIQAASDSIFSAHSANKSWDCPQTWSGFANAHWKNKSFLQHVSHLIVWTGCLVSGLIL